jgi:hypothetical protein
VNSVSFASLMAVSSLTRLLVAGNSEEKRNSEGIIKQGISSNPTSPQIFFFGCCLYFRKVSSELLGVVNGKAIDCMGVMRSELPFTWSKKGATVWYILMRHGETETVKEIILDCFNSLILFGSQN